MGRLDRWITGPQMRQLRRLREQPDADHAWLDTRAQLLASHVRDLPTREKVKKLVFRLWHMLTPIRHWVMGMLYPAMHTESLAGKAHVAKEVRAGRASRSTIMTNDHVQLDALWVHGSNTAKANRRVIVFVLPNAETYEGCATLPEAWAQGLECDVLMFNYRGVGNSLGHIHSTRDGVKDTRAAIQHASREYDHVSVWGMSIGGATAIEALAEMQRDGDIDGDSIDSLLAQHSFTALDRVIGELTGSALVRWLARAALWCVGSSRLHAEGHLAKQRLARHTLVTSAENDHIIRGKASLAAMEACPAWVTTATWGEHHCDMPASEVPPLLLNPFAR